MEPTKLTKIIQRFISCEYFNGQTLLIYIEYSNSFKV